MYLKTWIAHKHRIASTNQHGHGIEHHGACRAVKAREMGPKNDVEVAALDRVVGFAVRGNAGWPGPGGRARGGRGIALGVAGNPGVVRLLVKVYKVPEGRGRWGDGCTKEREREREGTYNKPGERKKRKCTRERERDRRREGGREEGKGWGGG